MAADPAADPASSGPDRSHGSGSPADRPRGAAVASQERRPGILVAAAVIGLVEALGLLGYAAAVAISVWEAGEDLAAAPVEIAIFVLFAAGIGLVVRGLLSRRHLARGPYVVTQLFGLVVGATLVAGDGLVVDLAGWIVLALSVAGIALMLNPRMRDLLTD